MIDIPKAFSVLNSLLVEAQLKDSFSLMGEGNIIRVVLKDKSERTYEVAENLAGRVVVVDKKSEIWYTFTKDSMVNGVLTLTEFDGDKNKPDVNGDKLYLEIQEFLISQKNGDLEKVDVFDPENSQRMNDFNSELKSAEKGDMIYISSEEKKEGGEDLTNTILLKVLKVEDKKRLICSLDSIDTNRGEGDAESSRMKILDQKLKNRNIYIFHDNLVKFKNDGLSLAVFINNNSLTIVNILGLEVHKSSDDLESDEERALSKKELVDKIKATPEFLQAIDKTPNFWDTLRNASPQGVNQMNNVLNKQKVNNSYLTKGNKIKWKLESGNVKVNNQFYLKNGNIYRGDIIANGVIQYRKKRTGHWELEILKELDPSTYNVKITFYDTSLDEKHSSKGTIKIVENIKK